MLPSNLGLLIAEKKPSGVAGYILLPFGALLALCGLLVVTRDLSMAAVGLLMGSLLIAMSLFVITSHFEIRELGATARSIYGERQIAFNQMKTFGFSRVIHRVYGVIPAGRSIQMIFYPHTGRPMIFTVELFLQKTDADLEALREKLAARIAAKMERELQRKGRVEWIFPRAGTRANRHRRIFISRDGFVVPEPTGERTYPFADVEARFVDGQFMLLTRQNPQKVYEADCASPNFYPGLELVESLTRQRT
jgi:hypothetical protein